MAPSLVKLIAAAAVAGVLPSVMAQTNGTTFPTTLSSGDSTFILICAVLVFIMTPGLGFFYGGLARSQHVLSTIITGFLTLFVVTIQWFLWGYSLVYSPTGGTFIGNFDNIVLKNVDFVPHPLAPTIPALLFMLYQLFFAIITPALVVGSVAERLNLRTFCVFVFVWTTFVYDFVACWTWGPMGWLKNMAAIGTAAGTGAIDFAGGGPVHIASGFSALAYTLVVGKRKDYTSHSTPHNIHSVLLGTAYVQPSLAIPFSLSLLIWK